MQNMILREVLYVLREMLKFMRKDKEDSHRYWLCSHWCEKCSHRSRCGELPRLLREVPQLLWVIPSIITVSAPRVHGAIVVFGTLSTVWVHFPTADRALSCRTMFLIHRVSTLNRLYYLTQEILQRSPS